MDYTVHGVTKSQTRLSDFHFLSLSLRLISSLPSHFNINDAEKKQHFWHTMLHYSHVRLLEAPWTIQTREFSRPEYSPGDFPNPGVKPRSPALQADSSPAEPQEKPKNTGVGSLSLLQ